MGLRYVYRLSHKSKSSQAPQQPSSSTRGGITGSRVAGALGRIPVETSLRDSTVNHLYHGLTFDTTRMHQFSWVDNLVAVGAAVDDTKQLLNGLATTLQHELEMAIQDGSKQLLTNNTHNYRTSGRCKTTWIYWATDCRTTHQSMPAGLWRAPNYGPPSTPTQATNDGITYQAI